MATPGMRHPPLDTSTYFKTLVGTSSDGFVELRFRVKGGYGMRRRFFRVDHALAAAAFASTMARTHDVFAGCIPRPVREGGKDALAEMSMLWVDCDNAVAVQALDDFEPMPAMKVRSSERGMHAYWPLHAPVSVRDGERANRKLANALGACQSAVVNAAAVLRPPETFNHKYDPPAQVRLVSQTGELFDAADVVADLPDPSPLAPGPSAATRRVDSRTDPLLAVPPGVYVEALFGLTPRSDGKVSCPFHSDSDPSFHCYSTPDAGWYCFGCGYGGDVYTLGELKFGIPARGSSFFELRKQLHKEVLPWRSSTESS
jgi:hypothetical protein